jgi:AraC family transcriptional regulator, transcriptional activator of pobA
MENPYIFPDLYSAIQLLGVQYEKTNSDWTYFSHRHPYFEFLYCITGEMELSINGVTYNLTPCNAVIIKNDAFHHMATHVPSSFFNFHFHIEHEEIHFIFQMLSHPIIPNPSHNEKFSLSRFVEKLMNDYAKELEHSKREAGFSLSNNIMERLRYSVTTLKLNSSMVDFISNLANYLLVCYESDFNNSYQVKPSQIKIAHEAANWLENNKYNFIKIQDLSQQLMVHRTHLNACFKKVYGISPSVFLINLRIREAKKLLRETNLSIETIAQQLCFSSASHFSRTFRSYTNTTPLNFRNQKNLNID